MIAARSRKRETQQGRLIHSFITLIAFFAGAFGGFLLGHTERHPHGHATGAHALSTLRDQRPAVALGCNASVAPSSRAAVDQAVAAVRNECESRLRAAVDLAEGRCHSAGAPATRPAAAANASACAARQRLEGVLKAALAGSEESDVELQARGRPPRRAAPPPPRRSPCRAPPRASIFRLAPPRARNPLLPAQGSEDEIEFDERVFGDSVRSLVEQASGALEMRAKLARCAPAGVPASSASAPAIAAGASASASSELFTGTQWKSVRVVPRLEAMALFGSEYIEYSGPDRSILLRHASAPPKSAPASKGRLFGRGLLASRGDGRWNASDDDDGGGEGRVWARGVPAAGARQQRRRRLLAPRPPKPELSRVVATDDMHEAVGDCTEVDHIVVNNGKGRCTLISETNSNALPYLTTRYKEKDSGVDADTPPDKRFRHISRLLESKNDAKLPNVMNRDKHHEQLATFLVAEKKVEAALKPVLARAAAASPPSSVAYKRRCRKCVLVMCINAGNLDLMLNFLCSARRSQIDISNLVVFVGDQHCQSALDALGVATFHHPALGTFPEASSHAYGDRTFVSMMWLKILCVYLTNRLGYDVLFQDADLIWFKDPWQFLEEDKASRSIDTVWMDDGARTSRYAPYFANTGFYLVRANPRTQQFMSELMFACVVARSRARARAPARERCALRARARLCPFPVSGPRDRRALAVPGRAGTTSTSRGSRTRRSCASSSSTTRADSGSASRSSRSRSSRAARCTTTRKST